MSDEIKVTISGADQLADALQSGPPAVAAQIIRKSLRSAVEPWRRQMIDRVRRGWHVFSSTRIRGLKGVRGRFAGRSREFGVISRNIRVALQIGAGGFEGSAAVYPSRRGYWAKFLEFGTKKMGRFPFVVPAYESGKNQVLDGFIASIKDQLRKEMRLS